MLEGRRSSTFSRLLRHGFTDPGAATRLLQAPELAAVRSDSVLLDALGATADPDLAPVPGPGAGPRTGSARRRGRRGPRGARSGC